MIPHTQTHTGTPDDPVPGNCVQAAVASLLDLPLEAVPHFALFGNRFGAAVKLWLKAHNLRLHVFTDSLLLLDHWGIKDVTTSRLSEHPDGELLVAHGASREGQWRHTVLWQGGVMVHDPNPSGRGLAGEPDEFWQITPADR